MADADAGAGILSGDDALCRIFINADKFGDDFIVSWSAKVNSTKYRDDQGGNKTSRVDQRVWGWDFDLKTRYKTDRLLKAMLAFYDAKMTPGATPAVMSIFFAIQDRTTAAAMPGYLLTPVVADYDLNMPGLKERMAQGISAWAEKLKPFVATP